MFLPPITCSWKRKVLQMTRQELLGEAQDQLMTRVPFPGSPTISWPLPLCRRCPPLSHGASLQNCVREHWLVRGPWRILFFPGCMLKAALPSEQPVLHPQQLSPTYLMARLSSTKVCMGTQMYRIKAFIHITNTQQGVWTSTKHLKSPRQLTGYMCKGYCQSGQASGKHFFLTQGLMYAHRRPVENNWIWVQVQN